MNEGAPAGFPADPAKLPKIARCLTCSPPYHLTSAVSEAQFSQKCQKALKDSYENDIKT
jgi:hypothetical protein